MFTIITYGMFVQEGIIDCAMTIYILYVDNIVLAHTSNICPGDVFFCLDFGISKFKTFA